MASTIRRVLSSRQVSALLWAAAVLACVGGLIALVHSATFPRAIASHPVRARATVTDTYINGLGGDPGVDYRYSVAGREYSGSALSDLRTGARVAIEYAAGDPGKSCICDAAHDAPQATSSTGVLAGLLSLPLFILVGRRARRFRLVRPAWFEPVHGFGEWAGFVGGLAVALAFGLIVLAYFFAAAVEP